MSSDEQFTAQGKADIGFQTNPVDGPIERGAEIGGTLLGVRGFCTNGPGVVGDSTNETGVEGESANGVGVTGTGATGVVGKGSKGPGIEGTGGVGASTIAEPGVIGRGGRQPDDGNPQGHPHGPGVVGIAGGVELDLHGNAKIANSLTIGSTGVFGFGSHVKGQVDGTAHEPQFPGAGVVGVGGKKQPHDDGPKSYAPGVVGVSGSSVTFPLRPGSFGDAGVFGVGVAGVVGQGIDYGPLATEAVELGVGVIGRGGNKQNVSTGQIESAGGVVGLSNGVSALPDHHGTGVCGSGVVGVKGIGGSGPGGVFRSYRSAQIHLQPKYGPRLPAQTTHTAEIVADPVNQGLRLPANGRAGDLMAISEGDGRCRLFFCVLNELRPGAKWAQVLLGPEFDGTA